MDRRPSTVYVMATIITAMLAIGGIWFSWVRKRPVGYTEDGNPYYTSEAIPGLEAGFQGIDIPIVLFIVAIVAITVWSRRWRLHPDGVLIIAGGLMLATFGNVLRRYWTTERYAVEPGLYLLIASSLLFILIGIGSLLTRRVGAFEDDGDSPTA